MSLSCLLFGHTPSSNGEVLRKAIHSDGFDCRRCGSYVKWVQMPKAVMVAVIKARNTQTPEDGGA